MDRTHQQRKRERRSYFARFHVGLSTAAALALTACASAPDLSEFKLPELSQFLPSNSNVYTAAPSARRLAPVGPEDLIDSQGLCSGMNMPASAEAGSQADADRQGAATASTAPPMSRGIALEMTECEVVRALGQPHSTEIGSNERGERSVVLTYTTGERPGIYRFVAGRLVSLERGPEQPAAKPDKPAQRAPSAKKQGRKGQST